MEFDGKELTLLVDALRLRCRHFENDRIDVSDEDRLIDKLLGLSSQTWSALDVN